MLASSTAQPVLNGVAYNIHHWRAPTSLPSNRFARLGRDLGRRSPSALHAINRYAV